MVTPSKLYVPRAEYEAEVAELRRLQTELASVQEKLSRIETETYNPLWRENVRLVRRIRYRETRLRGYATRLAELRRIGWARLHRLEREEYVSLREAIPRIQASIRELREAQEKVITELWRVTEELTPLRTETARLKTEIKTAQDKISRKVTVELKRAEINAYVIIEEREKTYYKRRRTERTARKHGKYVKVTVRYPKGRFQCVPPDTPIITSDGVKPIKDVKVGDKVLTHKGRFATVSKVFQRDYQGELVEIQTYYANEKIKLTPEHPILVIRAKTCSPKRGQICKPTCGKKTRINQHCKKPHYKQYVPQWVPAKELNPETDLILYPRMKTQDIEYVELPQRRFVGRNQYGDVFPHPSQHILPSKIPVSEGFMRLVGFYLAEGTAKKSGTTVTFAFNVNEISYIKEVQELLKRLFNLNSSVYVQGKAATISVCSRNLNKFFATNFGSNSYDKKIPEWVLHLPNRKLINMVKAYCQGDGWISQKIIKIGATKSPHLAYGLRLALFKLGLLHRVAFDRKRKAYHILLSHTFLKKFIKMASVSIKLRDKSRSCYYGFVSKGYVAFKIFKKRMVPYNGKVMNLHIDKDESYVLPNMTVHNCWVQLDAWVIPDTGTVLLERDPTYTLIKEYVIPHVNDELAEKFNILPFTLESFTFGETSTILSDEDLGKPPVKIKVERTVEDVKPEHTIKNPWEEIVSEEILTQEDYNRLVSDYPDYVEELKRLGKWRGKE